RLGLRTVADIANTPLSTMQRALGQAAGTHLHELSWGRDARGVNPHEPDKSIGNEQTFEYDIDDPERIHAHLLQLSDQVAGRLRSAGYVARTLSLKVRFADFTTITRSRTLDRPTDVGGDVYSTIRALYDALGLQRVRIRLVGVRAENLLTAADAPHQLFLGETEHGRREAEVAVDALRARFGSAAVRPARLVNPERRDDPRS
ncbi:MAG: DNA polymerase IV, partial [Chloroflexota bacterium]